ERVVAAQVPVEPAQHGHLEILRVLVGAGTDDQPKLVGGAVQFVDAADQCVQSLNAVQREDRVRVGVHDEQRTRGGERGDLRVIPAPGVDGEHAVAVALDRAVYDVVVEVGNAGHGRGGLDAVVERDDPPRVGAAAGTASDAEAGLVHFGPRLQVVQGADAVPRLDAGGRVAARVPPPESFAI